MSTTHIPSLGAGHTSDRPPIIPIRQRIVVLTPTEVSKRERRPARRQTSHALQVALLRHERVAFSPPAYAETAWRGSLRCIDAEERWANDVIFGEEQVDQGDALADLEGGVCEDTNCHHAYGICCLCAA